MQKLTQIIRKYLTLEFLRYVAIGIATQIVDIVSYYLLVLIGFAPFLADATNSPVIILVNYLGQKIFTFNDKQTHKQALPKYMLNYVILYVLSVSLVFILTEVIRVDALIAKLVAVVLVISTNYLILKKLIFQGENNAKNT